MCHCATICRSISPEAIAPFHIFSNHPREYPIWSHELLWITIGSPCSLRSQGTFPALPGAQGAPRGPPDLQGESPAAHRTEGFRYLGSGECHGSFTCQGAARGCAGGYGYPGTCIHDNPWDHGWPWLSKAMVYTCLYTQEVMVHNLFYPRRMYDMVLWGYLLGEMTKNRWCGWNIPASGLCK